MEKNSNPLFEQEGWKLIKEGKVAALVVAGGQATRLQLKGSKGLYPISPISKKTLFQVFYEKTLACSEKAQRHLSLCIMTSPLNDQEIKTYFRETLQAQDVLFFTQGMLPMKHLDGSLVMKEGKALEGPDGNGSALEKIVSSGILDELKKRGVEIVTFTMIDNPLADPFDAALIGFHSLNQLDASVVAVDKKGDEKVGCIVESSDGVRVIEYTDLDPLQTYDYANISIFAFSVPFIEKASKQTLPLHAHHKEVLLDPPEICLKFEKFIFDNLAFSKKVQAIHYPREEIFAPLKNLKGSDSPDGVKDAILLKDRLIYERISGLKAPSRPFELDFSFYYPTDELLKRWKGRPLPDEDYIKSSL